MTVIRSGKIIDLHQSDVVVGDVIQIFEGMEIPADCIAIEASELTCDESAMTGEGDPIKKNTIYLCNEKKNQIIMEGGGGKSSVCSPLLMSGTRVLNGEGKMVAIVVGDDSCAGKISALLRQEDEQPTPLQFKLEAIARDIGDFGLYSALLIILALLIRFIVERSIYKDWRS